MGRRRTVHLLFSRILLAFRLWTDPSHHKRLTFWTLKRFLKTQVWSITSSNIIRWQIIPLLWKCYVLDGRGWNFVQLSKKMKMLRDTYLCIPFVNYVQVRCTQAIDDQKFNMVPLWELLFLDKSANTIYKLSISMRTIFSPWLCHITRFPSRGKCAKRNRPCFDVVMLRYHGIKKLRFQNHRRVKLWFSKKASKMKFL